MKFLPKREIGISIGLTLITVFSYAGVLSSGFVHFDDNRYVYENRVVQKGLSGSSVIWAFTNTEFANWHPLTWLSLEADYQLFGLNPAGFHATNLLFHAANSVALFWLLRQMTGAVGRGAAAAAFFALHPLHVESVAWISERKDVLSTFFFLLSLLFWQLYARRSAFRYYALAVLLFVLSLMAKAMCVTFPLLLLLVNFWPLARWRGTVISLVIEKLPFFAIGAVFSAIAVLAQDRSGALDFGRTIPLSDRLLIVPLNYVAYLWRTLWPVDLAILYPHPGSSLPLWKPLSALVLLAVITMAVVRFKKSRRYLLVGWLWFLIALLPVIGLVQIGKQATADRYMYMPMIGLLVAACWGIDDLAGQRPWLKSLLAFGCAVLLCICAELTVKQVRYWHDDTALGCMPRR